MLAASLGGYAATTGTLVGGMVGALHGCDWVPSSWWQYLQDEPHSQESPAGDLHADQHSQHSGTEAHEQQQQPEAEDAVHQQESGTKAAAAEEGGRDSMLRPVGKHSVVALGQQLAELSCQEVAPLM